MKKALSIILSWTFVVLCSAETIPKFIVSSQQNMESILFSAGVESSTEPVKKKEKVNTQNYKALLTGFNADGA